MMQLADRLAHRAVDAVGRVEARFALSSETLPWMVRICQMVEGMPLAIELAAARVRVRSCADIADAIAHDLHALATEMQDVPERHRSVRAVFDWSWRLLTEDEQHVCAALSIFRGGIPHDAAAHVAAASAPVLAALTEYHCCAGARLDVPRGQMRSAWPATSPGKCTTLSKR